jgi:hypothetical protein
MLKISLLKNKYFLLFVVLILIPQLAFSSGISISTSTVITVSAIVGPTNNNNGNGGGGGGTGYDNTPTTVNFSGMAYPSSKVTILQNGNLAITTVADPQANFSVSLNNLAIGTYTFSVYAEDANGVKSVSFSFPIYITSGAIVNIGGIFLSPTINVDKSQVERGDTLTVFGQTVPSSNVNILFHSAQTIARATTSSAKGLYSYAVDTTPFDYGDHTAQSKTTKNSQVSANSIAVPFIVGLISKKNNNSCGTLIGDLNCDSKVNIIDFSIMAYWYKRANPPAKIDLNGDGKITLADFSIMAFYWTG